jgi:hypothetical protein
VVGHLVGQKREDIGGVAHGRISSDVRSRFHGIPVT